MYFSFTFFQQKALHNFLSVFTDTTKIRTQTIKTSLALHSLVTTPTFKSFNFLKQHLSRNVRRLISTRLQICASHVDTGSWQGIHQHNIYSLQVLHKLRKIPYVNLIVARGIAFTEKITKQQPEHNHQILNFEMPYLSANILLHIQTL